MASKLTFEQMQEALDGFDPGMSTKLQQLVDERGHGISDGELAKLALTLSQIGNTLIADLRERIVVRRGPQKGKFSNNGVTFTIKEAGVQQVVNTKRIRNEYPIEEYPKYYNHKSIKGTVAIYVQPPEEESPAQPEAPQLPPELEKFIDDVYEEVNQEVPMEHRVMADPSEAPF